MGHDGDAAQTNPIDMNLTLAPTKRHSFPEIPSLP